MKLMPILSAPRLLRSPIKRAVRPRDFRSSSCTGFRTIFTLMTMSLRRDVLELIEALDLKHPVLAGYDWGGRAACVVSALWPERVGALVSMTGYNIATAAQPQSPAAEYRYWYQWYFDTDR